MSLTYRRDVPRTDVDGQREERDHVIAHLSSCVDWMDDPMRYAHEVSVQLLDHPDDIELVSIVGFIDRDPDAPYLRPDYDPDYELGGYQYRRWVPEVL